MDNVIVVDNSQTIAVIENDSYVTVIEQPNSVGVIVGVQGAGGSKGESATVSIVAPVNIGSGRVVMASGYYADNTDVSTINKAIGITQNAAITGDLLNVITGSDVNGFLSLTPNEPVYLSTVGTITQTIPTSGYIQQVGVAISTTKILVNLTMPIIL